MNSIPVIDISPLVQLCKRADVGQNGQVNNNSITSVVDQISHACETFGFFAVTNHGVDNEIIASAWNASEGFFNLDHTIKLSVPMSRDYPYGYENHESLGLERTTAAKSSQRTILRPDSKETFSIGPLNCEKSGMPSRKWPKDAPVTFATTLSKYFTEMENLASVLFRGLALALQLDDPSWFLRDGRFDDGHQCALRILNYPHLEYEEGNEVAKEVHIRAGAHTDYGAMTILKSGGPGLQLQLSSSESNRAFSSDDTSWVDVPHLSDAFIINIADLMQRWTNNRWKSTLHRVIAVANEASSVQNNENSPRVYQSARRQSIAFFVNMNGNANIVPFDSCVDDVHPSQYDAVKASDHLIQRHAQSMGNT
mmetsp:Transcript_23770/g.50898  ORF Transcript_23770/g.50898 Transcript_23770/m.50898 type:complete len:367 (+) Transcript_23770:66-1166(+)